MSAKRPRGAGDHGSEPPRPGREDAPAPNITSAFLQNLTHTTIGGALCGCSVKPGSHPLYLECGAELC
jgi:hypothetical protein